MQKTLFSLAILAHRILDATVVNHFLPHGRLAQVLKDFWGLPAPTLNMAIGERETSSLSVTISRHIKPDVLRELRDANRIAELSIEQRVGMLIHEHK